MDILIRSFPGGHLQFSNSFLTEGPYQVRNQSQIGTLCEQERWPGVLLTAFRGWDPTNERKKERKSTCSRLATPKAPFLSVISRHTDCCRVQSWQKHRQVLLCRAERHKEETFLQQTSQGEHSWMVKLFNSLFHLLLIVSQCLLQNQDSAAVSITTVTHSKVYHVRNGAFIIKFTHNYHQCQGNHIHCMSKWENYSLNTYLIGHKISLHNPILYFIYFCSLQFKSNRLRQLSKHSLVQLLPTTPMEEESN